MSMEYKFKKNYHKVDSLSLEHCNNYNITRLFGSVFTFVPAALMQMQAKQTP